MKSPKSNKPSSHPLPNKERLAPLIGARSELTDSAGPNSAIVLMTRIRLARNLAGTPFPGWAKESQRRDILAKCIESAARLPQFKKGVCVTMEELDELERHLLFERHLISRDLMNAGEGSGAIVSRDQRFVLMINEEDHLRIQVLRSGFSFRRTWSAINQLDSVLEDSLDFAFSTDVGYLTACPTNLGTAIRASAMMHLPALVLANQMEKVVRAVNQLGLTVRGLFGEGSEASGSIFQISNQTTLGETEENIIKRLTQVLNTVIEQEINARERILEADATKLLDKIGRAYGILQNAHLLTSNEAMNLISLMRLGADLGLFPEENRGSIDRLLIEAQPGHLQFAAGERLESVGRDAFRARLLRNEFEKFAKPDISVIDSN